jgi:transcriptional regulator with XRE-family HTH domain
LREWRKSKGFTQEAIAEILKINLKSYSAYETGRTEIPSDVKKRLEKAGYNGPWEPENESTLQTDIIELRAALTAHIGYWERGEEKVLRRLEDAHQRIAELEKQVSDLKQRVSR